MSVGLQFSRPTDPHRLRDYVAQHAWLDAGRCQGNMGCALAPMSLSFIRLKECLAIKAFSHLAQRAQRAHRAQLSHQTVEEGHFVWFICLWGIWIEVRGGW